MGGVLGAQEDSQRPPTTAWLTPATWPICSGSYYNVQVCGGQMGEKKKRNHLSIMKRVGTGDRKVERNSLL